MLYINEKELISHNLAQIISNAEVIGRLFYKRLFEVAPEVKPLFAKTSMEQQWTMFIYMIGLGVRTITHAKADAAQIESLGIRHVHYGVMPKHYLLFRDSLLWTLKVHFGDEFTPDHEAAWLKIFDEMTRMMTSSAYVKSSS